MRLQLILCLIGATSACGSTSASASGDVQHFTDEMVDVTSPRATAKVVVDDTVTVAPSWKADVITAATPVMTAPDVITRATEYSETRHEGAINVGYEQSHFRSNVGYILSVEPDWISHTFTMKDVRTLLNKRAELGVSLSASVNEIGRTDVASFDEHLTSLGVGASWSHIMSPVLVLQAAYSLEHRRGFQSNAYRLVPIFEADSPGLILAEATPRIRSRHALEAVAIWSASPTTYVHGSYRVYADDWGIVSHTARLELWQDIASDRLRLRARARAYTQGAAAFFREQYDDATTWRTGDYRLSQMRTLTVGPRVELRLLDTARWGGFRAWGAYDVLLFRLPQYVVLRSMVGHFAGGGLSLEVD